MANTITTNPIICNATGVLVVGSGQIKSVQFTNTGADADHTITLVDGLDTADTTRILIQLELTAEVKTLLFCPATPIPFARGLVCTVRDGGEALIQV